MAESSAKREAVVNTAVPDHGEHDRVAMLSLHPDGSPAQHNPEIIGNKEFALAAAKRQFAEQAVSAADSRERTVAAPAGVEDAVQDPAVAALQDKHEAARAAGESAAEKAVGKLFRD